MLPFDLHVLGLPPAFTLSQDQTLHLKTHSPRTKNLKLQMLDRWQRFACFETIDMLLDQTSARWTNHPSCRRLHKIPAHTVKERGSRPQRLPPYAPTFPSLRAAHYSRLFRFVNTLFRGPPHRSGRCCRCCLVVRPEGLFVEASRLLCQAFRFRQHLVSMDVAAALAWCSPG